MVNQTPTIPKSWKMKTLDNVVEIIDGDRGVNYPKNNEFFSDGYCLFLNTKNVPNDSFSFEETMFVDKEKDSKLRKGKLKRGDFVLTTRGTIGNFAFYSEKVPFDNIRINSGMVILRTADEILNKGYLNFYLKSYFFNNQVISLSSGTAQPQLPIKDLKIFQICLPPLPEQRAISAVLSSLDNKIELLRAQNKTLEATAQAIFKEKIVSKTQEVLPKGWIMSGLSDIADFLNGIALQKYPAAKGTDSFPAIKIKELKAGITDATDRVSKDLPEQYIVHDSDVLFSWSGSLEVVIWQFGDGALNQHLFKVTSEKYPKWFYYFWLLRHLPNFRAIAANKATTMGHIQRYHLDKAQVAIPDDATIKELNALMEPILNKVILNNSQIKGLTRLRDTILPKLMKGELRVSRF